MKYLHIAAALLLVPSIGWAGDGEGALPASAIYPNVVRQIVDGSVTVSSMPPLAKPAWTVAYAPETNLEKLDVELIGKARKTIDFAAYVLTDVAVIEALGEAARRGVHVRLYQDGGRWGIEGYAANVLARMISTPGVESRIKPSSVLMHLKSYLVDGTILRGGAANFSASGLKTQDNDRWETNDPKPVAAFTNKFATMWGKP